MLKKFGCRLAILLLVGFVVFSCWYFFNALFLFVHSPDTGETWDGLGRRVYQVPLILQWLYMLNNTWPGIWWSIVDWILGIAFFGALGGIVRLHAVVKCSGN
ncbi:MAG: hypothetical protein FWG05_02805, partial [Kiritimatiellaeota bacterium]|nr:hypothetical protein [Kiritimatiellota bacterium]